MLYTNINNYTKALKRLDKNPMICVCGKTMKPKSRLFGSDNPT